MADNDNVILQGKNTDFYHLWITPGLVVIGIIAVIIIFRMALTIMLQGVQNGRPYDEGQCTLDHAAAGHEAAGLRRTTGPLPRPDPITSVRPRFVSGPWDGNIQCIHN